MNCFYDLEARYRVVCAQYNNLYPIKTVEEALKKETLLEEMLQLERELALSKGGEAAIPMNWPRVDYYSMNHTPVLLSNEMRTLLLYTTIGPVSDSYEEHISIYKAKPWFVLLEFLSCASAKIGPPNDEVFDGHPLFGRGIDVGGAYIVANSDWKKKLMRINQIHPQYNQESWEAKNHYLWFFKESAFEAIASEIIERMYSENLQPIIRAAIQMLME